MDYREINGVKIPLIGLGTFGIGGGMYQDNSLDLQDIEAISYAISLGLTHIDTAEIYAAGHSEQLIGQAIKNFPREKLFITTKVHPSHLKHDEVLVACQGSLKRLGVDYIDLYLVHWPNPDIPLPETMAAMDELVKKGLTKFIGVSNFDVKLLKEAEQYSENKIVNDQVEYSLQERSVEEELLPYCQQNNVILTAYTPLKGIMATHPGGVLGRHPGILDNLARKYGKTPAQIALNYLISQDNVIVIPKAAKKEHIKENAGAAGWKLEPEDIEALREEF